MRKFLSLTCFLTVSHLLPAQDTIRLMSYNVLNYSDSNYPTRYNDLKEIVAHVQPDIVICQEMVNSTGAQLLLDNAFNPGGGSTYSRVTFVNGPDSDNMLYYKTSKFNFVSQTQITTDLRNITHYRVFHLMGADTAWLNIFSLHLKASTGGGEEATRLQECKDLCTYFAGLNANENILVGGDFNFYSNLTETGFNWLTSNNCARRLYDPINRVGDWNNNASYIDVHTQSTRTANEPDGGSTGGLDDRFDFIFANDRVINGLSKVRYIPGSYTNLGNDHNHFNKAINAAPTNTAVPVAVANALYNMSDHLPIYLDLAMGTEVGMSEYQSNLEGTYVKWIFREHSPTVDFLLTTPEPGTFTLRIFDLAGKEAHSQVVHVSEETTPVSVNMGASPAGQYLLKVEGKEGWTGCKFIRY